MNRLKGFLIMGVIACGVSTQAMAAKKEFIKTSPDENWFHFDDTIAHEMKVQGDYVDIRTLIMKTHRQQYQDILIDYYQDLFDNQGYLIDFVHRIVPEEMPIYEDQMTPLQASILETREEINAFKRKRAEDAVKENLTRERTVVDTTIVTDKEIAFTPLEVDGFYPFNFDNMSKTIAFSETRSGTRLWCSYGNQPGIAHAEHRPEDVVLSKIKLHVKQPFGAPYAALRFNDKLSEHFIRSINQPVYNWKGHPVKGCEFVFRFDKDDTATAELYEEVINRHPIKMTPIGHFGQIDNGVPVFNINKIVVNYLDDDVWRELTTLEGDGKFPVGSYHHELVDEIVDDHIKQIDERKIKDNFLHLSTKIKGNQIGFELVRSEGHSSGVNAIMGIKEWDTSTDEPTAIVHVLKRDNNYPYAIYRGVMKDHRLSMTLDRIINPGRDFTLPQYMVLTVDSNANYPKLFMYSMNEESIGERLDKDTPYLKTAALNLVKSYYVGDWSDPYNTLSGK
jgi:hypothetical protein